VSDFAFLLLGAFGFGFGLSFSFAAASSPSASVAGVFFLLAAAFFGFAVCSRSASSPTA
jgi:hypothetical protein